MDVFVVQHVHEIDEDHEDVKMIGVYSTEAKAREAVARLSRQPGFRESTAGFEVNRYPLDNDHWPEGFVTLQLGEE